MWSDNLGVTWNPVLAGSGNVDRGHLWVDALSRVHVAWTEQLPSHRIKVALSQDNGGSYAPDVEISDASDTEQDFHVNLHSGPGPGSTYVYATWTTADTDPRRDEKNLGFARSLDGVSWQPAVRITTVGSPSVPLYVRGTSVSGLADGAKNTRTLYSNPSLAVDQTTGHIWLAWCNRGNPLVPPAGSGPPSAGTNDRNIYVIKSTDFGQTWTLPAGLLPSGEARPVNQDPPSTPNTADQWFPRIARDHATGTLAVLFYDSRNHNYGAGDYTADVYLAVSRDGGVTWEDFKISDTLQLMDGSGVYKPTFTNPGNDYVGLAASHGRAYAVWADDRTRGHLRINSSRVLLWGILQSSVAAAYVNLSGNMIRVTATWNTNMAASVADQLILVSPNQQQYVSPLCTTCSPGGLSHTLVFDAPCEPGLWSFTVKSKESFGTERQSATATFFVAPTVIAGGTIVSNYPGVASYTCPGSDGVSRYVASVDFEGDCVSLVNAGRLTLEALPMNELMRKMAFFPQAVPQPADGPATVGNGYATAITERQIGGCNGGPAAVYLDGVSITSIDVPSTPSVDLNGSGTVDGADVAILGVSLGRCVGSPSYDPCANFVSLNNCVDSSELANLAAHMGHRWDAPISKGAAGIGAVTKLVIDPSVPAGTAVVDVRLEGLQERSALGVVMRPAAGKLQFSDWAPKPEHASTAVAVAGVDAQGPRLVLLVFDVTPDASGVVALGRLTFDSSGAVTADDLVVSYESVASYSAVIESVADRRGSGLVVPPKTELAQNIPNPFNPRTTIRYTLARDSRVRLTVFNVAGRLVQTLVENHQLPGEYTVVWDGKDENGLEVASGIYLYRLATNDFADTKKFMLLR